MKNYKTILITGGTGLLGKGMEETTLPNFSIVAVHKRDYVLDHTAASHLTLDILDKRAVDGLFEQYEFDTVIHAAGIADVDYVETHYDESREANLKGTLNIASACLREGRHLIYISSNAVFDGSSAPYGEADPVRPLNKYGRIKVECERLVCETLTQYTVVRPILMYGWNHAQGRPNPATWMLNKLARGETINVVQDVYENPIYNRQCGEAIWEIIKKKPSGIIHLAGGDVLNRHQFALKVADVFGLDHSLIRPVDSSFFPSIAPRPKNTSYVTTRMETELGMKPLDVEQGLRSMKTFLRSQV